MENLKNKIVKARKEHICNLCGKLIKIGENYEDNFIIDGGDHWTWKECINCNNAATILSNKKYLDLSDYDADEYADALKEYLYDLSLEQQAAAIVYLEEGVINE